ncbi:putative RNA helicase [Helianthus debilis subsp. tardiflorus]
MPCSLLTLGFLNIYKFLNLVKCCAHITDIENLVVAPISKASARQRARRTGRIRPEKCYRLYTEDYFVNEMSSHGIPEMQRSNLASSVIQLKALGSDNILGFDWLHHHHLN